MTRNAPFAGITVVDFTHVLAGPACSYFLGLMGAYVIKVESRIKGDAIRHRGGTDAQASGQGMSTPYQTQGAGKHSIALDLEDKNDREIFERLLTQADVFVENHLPSTMKALGLDEGSLRLRHPNLIICALTAYGRGGPQEDVPGYDVNLQAASGLMEMTGTIESGPTRTGAPILDYATGLAAAFAISSALFARQNSGKGAFLDVSMQEVGFTLMASTITDYLATGHRPKRRGNAANSRSPGAGSFPCKTGMLSLGVNEEIHVKRLMIGLGREAWLKDPRFATPKARQENAEAFSKLIEDVLLTKTSEDWEAELQAVGVPCARVRSLPEALHSEHVTRRDYLYDLGEGAVVPGLPFKIDHQRLPGPFCRPPRLGEDQETVMKWLREREAKR